MLNNLRKEEIFMNKKKIFAVILIIALIVLSFVGVNTFAMYESSPSVHTSMNIAKWSVTESFLIDGESSKKITNVNLAKTCKYDTLVDGKIVPGTSGDFTIEIDATGTESGIDYNITFENIIGPKLNILYTYNDTYYSDLIELSKELSGQIAANADSKILSLEIGWVLPYENLVSENSEMGDGKDTLDGETLSYFNFDVTIKCTQQTPKA